MTAPSNLVGTLHWSKGPGGAGLSLFNNCPAYQLSLWPGTTLLTRLHLADTPPPHTAQQTDVQL